jgi:hypothetical protein
MRNDTQIREEIEGLRSLTTAQLKEKYREVFGEQSRSNHKQFLFRRLAWRIQGNAWGGLSERARRRAIEIADDAALRIRAPKNALREPIDDGRTSRRGSNRRSIRGCRCPARRSSAVSRAKTSSSASARMAGSNATAGSTPR